MQLTTALILKLYTMEKEPTTCAHCSFSMPVVCRYNCSKENLTITVIKAINLATLGVLDFSKM